MGSKRFVPDTERPNPRTGNITELGIREIVKMIHSEDMKAYESIGKSVNRISVVIDRAVERLKREGRIIYVGSGTSGRVGSQDAIEMWPTYGLGKDTFEYVIAGGRKALTRSIEGAEDSKDAAVKDLRNLNLNSKDCVIGITASGRTPFVAAALEEAKSKGCFTAAIVNSKKSPLKKVADVVIFLDSGPEVIQGSTRMKAGTSQKMALNIISTAIAIKLGRTYGNKMFHMKASFNEKLKRRAVRMIKDRYSISSGEAEELLKNHGYNLEKTVGYLERVKKEHRK